jgi:hypothetical protein
LGRWQTLCCSRYSLPFIPLFIYYTPILILSFYLDVDLPICLYSAGFSRHRCMYFSCVLCVLHVWSILVSWLLDIQYSLTIVSPMIFTRQSVEACGGSGGIAERILNRRTRCWWAVSLIGRSLCPLGWSKGQSGHFGDWRLHYTWRKSNLD